MSLETGAVQENDDDGQESTIVTRNSAVQSRGELEGFSEDFSQMLRAHFREKSKLKKVITHGHVVTFSFVISLSTPLSADRLVELEAKAAKKKNQGGIQGPVDPSVAISHIHTEYTILPGDPPLKTDVVFYATAARIFPDRHEPKTVRTWWADGQLWCSWTHSHSVHVTDALLRRVANHTIEVRLWDSRDKLSQRARLDRPRGFRASDVEGLPPSGMGMSMTSLLGVAGGVVVTQAKLYAQDQPRQILFTRPFTQTIRKHAISVQQKSEGGNSHGGPGRGSPTPPESKGSDMHGAKVIAETGNQLRDYSQIARTGNVAEDYEDLARRKRLNAAYRHGQAANMAILKEAAQGSTKRDSDTNNAANKANGGNSLAAKRMKQSQANIGDLTSRTDGANSDANRVFGGDIRSSITSLGNAAVNNQPAPSSVVQNLRLRMATLYDGRKSSTCRIAQPQGLIADCLMTLIVDPSLLSENQMAKFKPVTVRIVSAGPLPPGFVTSNAIFCRCVMPDLSPMPTADIVADVASQSINTAQTRAMDELLNKEKQSQQQEADLISTTDLMQPFTNNSVYWNHTIVLLTGDIPDDALRFNLLKRPLFIELHDREQPNQGQQAVNTNVVPGMKPAVFGTLPNDSEIASTAVLPPPPPEPPKPPYGLAEFSLNDLLVSPTGKGISFSEATSVVKPIRPAGNVSEQTNASVFKRLPLPRYLEYGTIVKISARAPVPLFTVVNIPMRPEVSTATTAVKQPKSAPLSSKSIPAPPPEVALLPSQCVATLVILIPSSLTASAMEGHIQTIDLVLSEIVRDAAVRYNSESLGLSSLVAPEERASALMAYQLAPVQQIDRSLNLITGFHLVDEDGVLLVVEGFTNVISQLWDNVLNQVREFESAIKKTDARVNIFYNSSLSSPIRRYGGLDLSFASIYLGRGVSKIVAEPLLYVRDMAPALCRSAAVKLSDLRSTATSLADIYRRDLLPSSAELRSLADEFAMKAPTLATSARKESPAATKAITREETEPQMEQQSEPTNEEVSQKIRDFMRENAEEIWQQSEKNRLRREATETISVAVNTGHVYSSHSVNAVEIAKIHIRNHMLQPNRRYSFCQDYHHRSMTPRSASPERLSLYPHAHHWQFPGFQSAIQANKHSRMPDTARLEEITQPWRENWLHEKYLQPPLVERGRLPWELRKADLNLYEVPKPDPTPLTIFKPGDGTEFTLDSLPPRPDRRLRVFRRGVRSELEDFSGKLSLIDRVADVLHDAPAKLSLRFRSVQDIPKISILSDDPPARNEKCIPFGPLDYNNWLMNRNIFPLKS